MTDQEPQFIDAEEQFSDFSKGMTFQQLILMHLHKISVICTQEFTKGFWTTKVISSGGSHTSAKYEKIYHPDLRDSYVNAIGFLHDMLIPHFDKAMEKKSEDIEKSISEKRSKLIILLKQDNTFDAKEKMMLFKLDQHRKLFQELSRLLHRLGYLKGRTLTE